jgi:hypothetical protein
MAFLRNLYFHFAESWRSMEYHQGNTVLGGIT